MTTVGQQVLKQVVDNFGPEHAAALLGVSESLVEHFVNGTLPVPDSILLKALDLLEVPHALPQQPNGNKPNAP